MKTLKLKTLAPLLISLLTLPLMVQAAISESTLREKVENSCSKLLPQTFNKLNSKSSQCFDPTQQKQHQALFNNVAKGFQKIPPVVNTTLTICFCPLYPLALT